MRHASHTLALAMILSASAADAATLHVSPTGVATSECTRRDPCSLGTGGYLAAAGDTVILMDGIYDTPLWVVNSGTPDAWITFQADQCATPIIEGPGVGPTEMVQDTGVGSADAEYVRFVGLVARGWNIGFGNGWTGGVDSEEESNGNWEIENCISYSNGRTGFTFFSAENFTLEHSIAAHNGSSQVHSWSSGVTLFEAHGTNLVEGNISFENTDAERNTDGSGFIVDEETNGAAFINNIAFGNAGSCLRLTDSSGTVFVNNTCYRNSQFGNRATGPSNPGELYFTNAGVTVQNVTFMNNVIVGTGQSPAGPMPVVNQPQSGWSNNVVTTGQVDYLAAPEGMNPDFSPAAGETTLTGQGMGGDRVPTTDIGLDPKCIVKRTPQMVGSVAAESWWSYDIDIEYIQSIGGVAACFNPRTRQGSDIGAATSGELVTVEPGSCVPPPEPEPEPGVLDGGVGGSGVGGTAGAAGAAQGGASGGLGGGAAAAGGMAPGGAAAAGGSGTAVPGGTAPVVPGPTVAPTSPGDVAPPPATSGPTALPETPDLEPAPSGPEGVAPTPSGQGGAPVASSTDATDGGSSCSCRVVGPTGHTPHLAAFAFLSSLLLGFSRRRMK